MITMDQSQIAAGREMLQEFHLSSLIFPNYKLSFDELLEFYGSKTPFLLEGLGFSLSLSTLDMDEAKSVMRRMARLSAGQVPANWLSYNSALAKESSNPGFFKTIKFVTSETVKDVITSASDIGGGLMFTAKYSKFLIPVGVLIGIYAVSRAFGAKAGKGIGAGAKALGRAAATRIGKK